MDSGNEMKAKPFGTWLLEQTDRPGWISGLAKAAKTDRSFPRNGDIDAVRKRFQETGADGDAFEALDDAEMDYLAL